MGLVSPNGSKMDFEGDPFFESVAWFFVINLKFILTLISEIEINKKIPWHQKNFIFEGRFS